VTRLAAVLHDILGRVLVVLVGLMTLTVGWQVASRLLARLSMRMDWPPLVDPSRWTEELAGFQLAWLALLGAAYALRRGEHLGLDVLHQKLSPSNRRRADLAVAALVAGFSVLVLGLGGLRMVAMTIELHQRTPALGWPMAVIYSVVPVTGVLMGVFAVEAFLRTLREEPR
jgi:TRAP-type C4-dicarboxylate transport system permease small subunit